eukprot:CAMPEP_0116028138 /NCGR_PEP_ID=MMETSP0321-20121206/15187_1 /TAXON_ID=163516 /ORGANISM="Leptocylindrus danicus var. danicus, Strain B650" /LENGTH=211 /DNA_ID=CAMNT_0003501909 /DNA_START=78 /DNA_END=713 /DNA_ORIENTATION=-
MAQANTAPIKWAQRSDSLYITIALPDVKDENIQLEDGTLNFTGTSNSKPYTVAIEFFKPVSSEESTYKVLPRSVQMHVVKKDQEDEFWPRLLKDKAKEKNQVKIDWDRYVDEDEEEEEGGFDMSAMEGGMGMGGAGMGGAGGGMPPGMDMEALMKQMGGMGGLGGAGPGAGMGDMSAMMGGGMPSDPADDLGGDNDSDDDSDDDLPDLEDA